MLGAQMVPTGARSNFAGPPFGVHRYDPIICRSVAAYRYFPTAPLHFSLEVENCQINVKNRLISLACGARASRRSCHRSACRNANLRNPKASDRIFVLSSMKYYSYTFKFVNFGFLQSVIERGTLVLGNALDGLATE